MEKNKWNIIIWASPILWPMVSSSSESKIRTDVLIKFAWASCLLKPHDLHQDLKHRSKHVAFIRASDGL